jgi:DNA-binding IclR family transcriptional regulator
MVQTVARAVDLLRLVGLGPTTLTQAARALEVHKSTALRLLQTLEEEGFVRRGPGGSYVLGFGLIPLALAALDQIDMRTAARPHLQALAAQLGHTVHLAQHLDGRIVYIDKVDGRGTVAMGSRVGLPTDLHTAAVAKAILSHLPDPERSKLLEQASFERYSPTTITSEKGFLAELDRTRARGWAEDDGEKEDYINCVAVPIRDATGRVTAGLSVTALRAVAPLDLLRQHVPTIRAVAERVSHDLGWRPTTTPTSQEATR